MAVKKRKKIRVRWGRLLILIGILAAIIGIPATIIWYVLFNDGTDSETDGTDGMMVSPEMLRCDSIMAHRVDSVMNIPQRLDTSRIAICIYDATSGMTVYRRHASDTLPPASCMKVPTALAALKTLGFDHRFTESLQMKGDMVGDTLRGNLLLRADADPLVESFDELIQQLKRRGVKCIDGNVYFDLAKTDTLRPHPSAKTWDIPYHKLPVLLKGEHFVHRTFLYSLHVNGISYRRNANVKPKGKYRVVAQSSHLLRDVVTPMLIHSSNIKAEAILYHLNWKTGLIDDHRQHWDIKHSTEAYLRGEDCKVRRDSLWRFVINDGSGLSPYNRLSADYLVEILKSCYEDGQMFDYLINEGLATPGNGERRGSLLSRLSRPEYANRIFVKTGTLTTIGASSLSGYLKGADEHWYVFSIINTDSPVAEARMFQDRLCKTMMSGR